MVSWLRLTNILLDIPPTLAGSPKPGCFFIVSPMKRPNDRTQSIQINERETYWVAATCQTNQTKLPYVRCEARDCEGHPSQSHSDSYNSNPTLPLPILEPPWPVSLVIRIESVTTLCDVVGRYVLFES
ncbi:hypothetical protein F5Y01DRAFT_49998 [Xylaria sp. FL0043]|nr:hypothetical protein F5Y01DRAFT_49998 [Xylaria sp. FL0043]